MISFSYQISRDEILANLKRELAHWGGMVVGDINNGGFSVLEGSQRIRAAYSFTFELVYIDIVDKPDYVTMDIMEEALKPFFEKGELALFISLLEEVSAPEEALEPA